jgi:2-oxoglutarate dehydrogenase complex dehydrogenase (E1) component-like enzyme
MDCGDDSLFFKQTTQISKQVSRLSQQKMVDLSEIIAEEFGANAEYVQGLLERFRTNPDLVDDSWRSYFSEILGDGAGTAPTSGNGAGVAVAESAEPRAEVATETRNVPKVTSAAAAPAPESSKTWRAVSACRLQPPKDASR